MANSNYITRSELVELLSITSEQDKKSVYEQMNDFFQEGEWTEEERDTVLDFLAEQDQKKADEIFAKILDTVKSRPTYKSIQEWKEERASLAQQIKDIGDLERDYKNKIQHITKFASKENELSFEMASQVEKEKFGSTKTLEMLTKQKSALSLMYAFATSEIQQIRGHQFKEATQSVLDAIQTGWSDLRDKVRDAIDHARNNFDLVKMENEMSLNVEKTEKGAERLFDKAAKEIKAAEKIKKQIRETEDKMIKQANKALKRGQLRDDLSAQFMRGQKSTIKEVSSRGDADKVLSQVGNEKMLENYRSAIRDLEALLTERNGNAQEYIRQAEQNLSNRREEILETQYYILDNQREGIYGRRDAMVNHVLSEFNKDIENTFVNRDKVDPNVLEFIKNNNIGESVFRENYDLTTARHEVGQRLYELNNQTPEPISVNKVDAVVSRDEKEDFTVTQAPSKEDPERMTINGLIGMIEEAKDELVARMSDRSAESVNLDRVNSILANVSLNADALQISTDIDDLDRQTIVEIKEFADSTIGDLRDAQDFDDLYKIDFDTNQMLEKLSQQEFSMDDIENGEISFA